MHAGRHQVLIPRSLPFSAESPSVITAILLADYCYKIMYPHSPSVQLYGRPRGGPVAQIACITS
jgi:hypothetical protein